jgi:site-specific DNA recombinase
LKELLADIDACRIDCVVVYKVDRLNRSLLDFTRLLSLFDKRRVSFVSVTQDFNTGSSMGRLTLDILLSFAQFEREISVSGRAISCRPLAAKGNGSVASPSSATMSHPEAGGWL